MNPSRRPGPDPRFRDAFPGRGIALLCLASVSWAGVASGAETAEADEGVEAKAVADFPIGFSSVRSVEGELAETAERQQEGPLAGFRAGKKELEDRTGLTYGLDNHTQYLDTDSDGSPSDAASNVTRVYGTWTVKGRGTPDNGALVFKVEYRTAIGDKVSTQLLGPLLGYAGTFASTYSDAGLVLTNLYWRQRFASGRGSFVVGQVDTYDYVNVNAVGSPWTGFTNLAFEQQPTYPGPSQGLGAALQWRLTDNWAVLGGFADANADASDPFDSAQTLFDTGETFKHLAVGWSRDWGDRRDQLVQLTFWQVDKRREAGVDGGHGVAFAASMRADHWRPFLRAGYAKDAGALLDRTVSVGVGYDSRGGRDLAGIGVNWGRAPDNPRDQYTVEAFYRYDVTDFLQLTPALQYVVDPANDPDTDDILVLGVRLRVFF